MDNKDFQTVFTWLKSLGGYDWEDCKFAGNEMYLEGNSVIVPTRPYLVERDCSQEIEAYKPFDDITLFGNFADIDAIPDSFKTWAGNYGMLTRGEKLSPSGRLHVLSESAIALGKLAPYGVLRTLPDGTERRMQPSESQHFWFKEHRDLSFTVAVWELAVNKDVERLKKIIWWIADNTAVAVFYTKKASLDKADADKLLKDINYRKKHTSGEEILFDKDKIRPWAAPLCRYPDLIRPAMLYVQVAINEKLKTYPLNLVIQTDERGKLYKTLQPTSLLSAMWYQFFLAFTGEEHIRRCAICGKWENMKGHRDTWKKHAKCASNERVKRFRKPDSEQKKK